MSFIILLEFPLITKDGRRIEVLLNATIRYDFRRAVTGGKTFGLGKLVYLTNST